MGSYRMSDGRHIECWFSISVGRWDRESLQQDRKHCQFASWVRRVFFSLPFLLRARRAKRMQRPCRQCVHYADELKYRTSDGRQIERWFLKFQSDVGIGSACNRTGNTANPRLGFGAFFSSLSFLKSLISLRGDTKDATRKATEPPFAF